MIVVELDASGEGTPPSLGPGTTKSSCEHWQTPNHPIECRTEIVVVYPLFSGVHFDEGVPDNVF